MNYEKYLQLDILLSAQKPLSHQMGRTAHDEMLFISVHHAYEIWFKQILFEVDSVLKIFAQKSVDESAMGILVSRLERVNEIFRVLIDQVDILETMTPMDFLDFRDLIYSASGFQSVQFRLLENKLGLRAMDRLSYNSQPYSAPLAGRRAEVESAEQEPTLFSCLEDWLSRTPFLQSSNFNFWEKYKTAAESMFAHDEKFIDSNSNLTESEKERMLRIISSTKTTFNSLFDEQNYEELRQQGQWRLKYRSVHAALLIQLYRDQPVFQMPFQLVTAIIGIDSHLTQWRYRHTIMVKRMLGMRIGTGGSTGVDYLKESTEKHKIFEDFYKLNTFFIPRNRLPELPEEFKKELGFQFKSRGNT